MSLDGKVETAATTYDTETDQADSDYTTEMTRIQTDYDTEVARATGVKNTFYATKPQQYAQDVKDAAQAWADKINTAQKAYRDQMPGIATAHLDAIIGAVTGLKDMGDSGINALMAAAMNAIQLEANSARDTYLNAVSAPIGSGACSKRTCTRLPKKSCGTPAGSRNSNSKVDSSAARPLSSRGSVATGPPPLLPSAALGNWCTAAGVARAKLAATRWPGACTKRNSTLRVSSRTASTSPCGTTSRTSGGSALRR